MWSVFSKGRRIFFSPNLNLIKYSIQRKLGSSLRFYKKIKSGYYYKWFITNGTNPTDQIGFNNLFLVLPQGEGIEENVDINWTDSTKPNYLPESNFAWEVDCYLRIEIEGYYTFNTRSDDGNELYINNQLITYFYGGRGLNSGETSNPIYLLVGLHYFKYRMQQGGGGSAAQVRWKIPSSDSFEVIPSSHFMVNINTLSAPTPTPTPTPTVTPTPTPTATLITSNLVLHYDPSNTSSYVGSGTTITDLSGNGMDGTMFNITHSLPFFIYNGSSSQVVRLDNALLEPSSGDWTMEVWINQTSSTGTQTILGKFDPGGASADISYAIRVIGGNVRADYSNGVSSVSTANYGLITGITYQLTYVFTNVVNNSIITYVNGVLQATTTHTFSSILNTSAHLYLGSYNGGEYQQWFNGKIGITRIYNSALTSEEVLQNFNANKSIYGL